VLGDDTVAAALADLDRANLDPKLRLVLAMLRTVTRGSVTADDMRGLLAAGVTRAQIEDALDVGWAFNVITRLADTFEFEVPTKPALEVAAKMLLKRGYK
jgi:hypothetical protein